MTLADGVQEDVSVGVGVAEGGFRTPRICIADMKFGDAPGRRATQPAGFADVLSPNAPMPVRPHVSE